MHQIQMFDRKGALSLDGFEGSGADWLERYKPYIEDGQTVGETRAGGSGKGDSSGETTTQSMRNWRWRRDIIYGQTA